MFGSVLWRVCLAVPVRMSHWLWSCDEAFTTIDLVIGRGSESICHSQCVREASARRSRPLQLTESNEFRRVREVQSEFSCKVD